MPRGMLQRGMRWVLVGHPLGLALAPRPWLSPFPRSFALFPCIFCLFWGHGCSELGAEHGQSLPETGWSPTQKLRMAEFQPGLPTKAGSS